ncbi:hypothetical protein PDIG_27180 [Penicillium digitatum PHI26]|uniref:Uncharacterized protein n=2 Tax=Penicillium digitatum TaxID=36651 RepID=K9G030_PEND2|nr:hypothetical protein PDIP_61620 [Penicillium digitatum Pd1]EKV10024.1 hypothetical protein PDIP_61620 [Penicillium digitatum Pd1]EKV15280.1 hypothetical protein PDIG_27180 [Penicillium digitatum PHI26]
MPTVTSTPYKILGSPMQCHCNFIVNKSCIPVLFLGCLLYLH